MILRSKFSLTGGVAIANSIVQEVAKVRGMGEAVWITHAERIPPHVFLLCRPYNLTPLTSHDSHDPFFDDIHVPPPHTQRTNPTHESHTPTQLPPPPPHTGPRAGQFSVPDGGSRILHVAQTNGPQEQPGRLHLGPINAHSGTCLAPVWPLPNPSSTHPLTPQLAEAAKGKEKKELDRLMRDSKVPMYYIFTHILQKRLPFSPVFYIVHSLSPILFYTGLDAPFFTHIVYCSFVVTHTVLHRSRCWTPPRACRCFPTLPPISLPTLPIYKPISIPCLVHVLAPY